MGAGILTLYRTSETPDKTSEDKEELTDVHQVLGLESRLVALQVLVQLGVSAGDLRTTNR